MHRLADFYRLSAVLTGYDSAHLQGTGVGEEYCQTLSKWVRQDVLDSLYDTFDQLPQDTHDENFDKQLRSTILASDKLGPVARNINKMWYVSIWFQMTPQWNASYGTPAYDSPVIGVSEPDPQDYIISQNAYIQGLSWQAVGSHAMGANQPGFATWSFAPTGDSQTLNLK